MRYVKVLTVLACVGMIAGCADDAKMAKNTFGDDLKFLKKHTEVVILSDASGNSQVAVLPEMQGRVMTSSAEGTGGLSFGWINRELISSGENGVPFDL